MWSVAETSHQRAHCASVTARRVSRPDLVDDLVQFWQSGGPVWDGLATCQDADGANGVILVEGKSYLAGIEGPGCQAGKTGSQASRQSRIKIASALRQTQTWLEMAEMPDWMGPLYQSANRLAHAYWLRKKAMIRAWLVHLLFANDPIRPTPRAKWQLELPAIEEKLGLSKPLDWHANVILEAKE